MTKIHEGETNTRYEPTKNDMDSLEKDLRKFTQKEINGRLVSRFDQFLIGQNVRKIDSDGSLICCMPEQDARYGRINAELELREYNREAAQRYEHPELQEAWVQKFRDMREKQKNLIKVA